MQTLTYCDVKSHEHAHSSWSVKGQFKGAMERWRWNVTCVWVRFGVGTHSALPRHTTNSEH